MAPWKQHILVLLTVVCLLERVLSYENLNQHKNSSNQDRELYVNNDYFVFFLNLALRNQTKDPEEIENSASRRGSSSREAKVVHETDNTHNQNNNIEDEWSFTKLLNYLLSFIYKLDEEENTEIQKSWGETKSKNNKRQPLNEKPFPTNNGECRTDDCDSIQRNEAEGRHRSVGENTDVSFDHEDKDNEQQAQKHKHENSNKSEGGISKETVTLSNESKENFQSVDSNPDVAFDRDDEVGKKGPLEPKYASKMSEEDEEEISDRQSTSVDESEDHIPSDDSDSDFEFSGENAVKVKKQETQLDEKSLPEYDEKEYHESSGSDRYFNSDIEKENVREKEKSVPCTSKKPVNTEELPGERNLSETQPSRKSKESSESKTGYLNQHKRNPTSEDKSKIENSRDKENSYKRQPMQVNEKEENFQGLINVNEDSEKESLPIEDGSLRTLRNERKGNNSMAYENGHENTKNESRSDISDISGKEKLQKETKTSPSREDSTNPTKKSSKDHTRNLTTKLNVMKIEREQTQEPNDLNSTVANHENIEKEKSLKDQNKTSKNVLIDTDESKIYTAERPMEMSPNDKLLLTTSPESLRPQQASENLDPSTRLETKDDRREQRNENGVTHDEEADPSNETGEDHDEEEKLNDDSAQDDYEEVEHSDEDSEYHDDEDEIDEDVYDYNPMYFDYFPSDDEDNYPYDEVSGHTHQEWFNSQTNENVTGNPKAISNESYEERNQSYSNNYKPPEKFNTILEYLYKYASNPLFISLKEQNDTETDNRNMTYM